MQSFYESDLRIVTDTSRIAGLLGEIGRAAFAELGGPTWWHVHLALFAVVGTGVLKKWGRRRFLQFAVIYAVWVAAAEVFFSEFVYYQYYARLDDGHWISVYFGYLIMSLTSLSIIAAPMLVLEKRGARAAIIAGSAVGTAILVWFLYMLFVGAIIMCHVAGNCYH